MDTSNEFSQLMKDKLFIHHLYHDEYLRPTANFIISKYFDNEVDPFMEAFHEAMTDASLGAHAMLPSTPAASRLRGRAVAEVPHPPPLPGKLRKRKAPAGHDSRKKRASCASDSTVCSDSDVTTLLSDASFLERESPRPTRQLPRRGKRKRVPVSRAASSVSRVTRSSSRARTDSISEAKLSIKSPSFSAALSQAPDRPAPPSFMESSVPSTPPDRPSPPSAVIRPTTPLPSLLRPSSIGSPSPPSLSLILRHTPLSPSVLKRTTSDLGPSPSDPSIRKPTTPSSSVIQRPSTPSLSLQRLTISSSSLPIPSPPIPGVSPEEETLCRDSTDLYMSPLAESTHPISPMQPDSLDKSSCNQSLSPVPDPSPTPLSQPNIPHILPSNPLTAPPHPQYDSPLSYTAVGDSSISQIQTPSFTDRVPLPTPSKTFSLLRCVDSDLCISPPSDQAPRVPANKTPRPLIQSPLLEQHSGPSRYASKYDHVPEEATPVSHRPPNFPTGVTHSIHKPSRFPHNSPSKFHQKCSPTPDPARPLPAPHTRLYLSTKPSANATANATALLSPVCNSSLQHIPRGLVSHMADRFQGLPGLPQCSKLATGVSTFFQKKPALPTARDPEESKTRAQQKHVQDEKRVVGLISMKQNVVDKKRQDNLNRQKIAAQRRAEITRLHTEKFSRKLEGKEEKRRVWERQSLRKKKAEDERRKREELEKKRADLSQLKTTLPIPPSSASTTFNTSSFLSTVPYNDVTSYQIDDLDSENTDDEEQPRHQVPSWATEPYLSHSLRIQCTTQIDTDLIFPPHHLLQPMELTLLFEYNRYRRTRRPYNYRTSSALWTSPMIKTS